MTGGRRTHLLAAATAVAAVLATVACGERSEPTGASSGVYPVTITSANDQAVTVAAPARRIALLDPSLENGLVALGARGQVAGVPVTSSGRLRPAMLASLHADFVIASSSVADDALSRAATLSRAPVYLMPDTSLREVEHAISQLGLITARPAAARRLVHAIERRRLAVSARLRGRPPATVFVDLGQLEGASDQTLIGDMVREAGGRNVAGGGVDAALFGIDDLLRADPDVFVATSEGGTTLDSLRHDPRTRRLTAVRQGRVVIIDSRLLMPGPAVGVGLEQLARALHPNALG